MFFHVVGQAISSKALHTFKVYLMLVYSVCVIFETKQYTPGEGRQGDQNNYYR